MVRSRFALSASRWTLLARRHPRTFQPTYIEKMNIHPMFIVPLAAAASDPRFVSPATFSPGRAQLAI